MLRMHKIAFLLACIACTGHGQRALRSSEQSSSDRSATSRQLLRETDTDYSTESLVDVESVPRAESHVSDHQSDGQAEARDEANPAQRLATLLLASHSPAAAFNPSALGGLHLSPDQQMAQRSPVRHPLQMPHHPLQRLSKAAPSSQRRVAANGVTMRMDAYQELGLSKGASKQEISKAYKKIGRQYHPDVNPNGAEKLEAANKAYEVLSDDSKRKMYDQYGWAGVDQQAQQEAASQSGAGSPFGAFGGDPFAGFGGGGFGGGQTIDLGDLFGQFGFGDMGGDMGGAARGPRQGRDVAVEIDIDFQTALFGGKKKVRRRALQTCATCKGSGQKPGARVKSCSSCGGRGTVIQEINLMGQRIQSQAPCRQCGGRGQMVDPCDRCQGRGLEEGSEVVEVQIPPGVDDGNSLRIGGKGNAGMQGAPPGDLIIRLAVKPDPRFKREGMDIYSDSKISYIDAILGTTIKVPTVDGTTVDLKVPAGTQPGTKLRMEGRGAPALQNKDRRGSHYITVKVEIPRKISEKEKEIIQQLQEISD